MRVCDTLSISFRLFGRKPGREPQRVCWFVRVLDKWNVEKPVLSKLQLAFDMLSTCLRPGFRLRLQLARLIKCVLVGAVV